ncbi:MAG: hypothetical protein KAS23_15345 [Anaerohalosphaera sp.]|nr:hypothetical protein [Anaerohalosphaera sp.]
MTGLHQILMIGQRFIPAAALFCVVQFFVLCDCAIADRRIAVGADMPVFTVTELSGRDYVCDGSSGRVRLIAFLSADQKQSIKAANDIQLVIDSFKDHRKELGIVLVMDDPKVSELFTDSVSDPNDAIHQVHDLERGMWGAFGVIVSPTVIIADGQGKVKAVMAGYVYDFIPVLRFNLNESLGVAQKGSIEDVAKVKTLSNNTENARAKRHLAMAKVLEGKGRISSAIMQLRPVFDADPNCVEVAVGLGRLYCLVEDPNKAIGVVGDLEVDRNEPDRAMLELVLGWAKRLDGDMAGAEPHLLEASMLNPRSAIILLELGELYQATGRTEMAMTVYKRALLMLMRSN